jgi:hypothetical protein
MTGLNPNQIVTFVFTIFFFFETGSILHYEITGAKSLATKTWVQGGMQSLTDTMSRLRPAPWAARATELQERGI